MSLKAKTLGSRVRGNDDQEQSCSDLPEIKAERCLRHGFDVALDVDVLVLPRPQR